MVREESGKAHRCSQLPGFGTHFDRERDGVAEVSLGHFSVALFEPQLAAYTERLGPVDEFNAVTAGILEGNEAFDVTRRRLAFDAAMSSFSGRQQLYERYFAGDPVRAAGGLYAAYDKQPHVERIWQLLDRFEKEAQSSLR